MTMRFREYLAGLSPDAQQALVDDLTLGAGRLVVAVRFHREDAPALTVLTTLAGTFAALQAAVVALGDTEAEAVPPATTAPPDQITGRWTATLPTAAVDVVGSLLQMAAEMARDAASAAVQDAEVDAVRELLRDALDVLAQVRDDALSTPRAPRPDTQP